MDEQTLKVLEFDKVRELVARYAPSAVGRELVHRMAPSRDAAEIRAAQVLVREMLCGLRATKAWPLGEIADVAPAIRRARSGAALSAETLREVAGTLHALKRLRDTLIGLGAECPTLSDRSFRLFDATRFAYTVEGTIDNRGRVVDTATRELSRLRQEMDHLDQRIRAVLRRLLRSESVKRILRYPNFSVTGSHYVLPVAREHRQEMAGVVHRASASGETLFIEPAEVSEMNAGLALLHAHEQKEVKRVLRGLSAELGKLAWQILESLEVAGEISLVYAKARFAADYEMTEPVPSDDGRLWLERARHPLLEHLFRDEAKAFPSLPAARASDAAARDAAAPAAPPDLHLPAPRRVVPIDLRLGGGYDVLVVTGPNTGGKTVALKTTGLLTLMAQAGLHIPAAEGSTVPVFDHILADIGDEQSIQQSLSTFSSHVSRIAAILKRATPHSLVLLDELGAGTDPAEGAALGRAILDEILARGARAVVTTHLGDLKLYALAQPRVENAAVEFDEATLRPTYRLLVGDTGRSNALAIARRLDLPATLVDRAEQYLASARTGRHDEFELLEARRAEAEAAREAAWQAEQDARRAREQYETRLRALERDADDELALELFRAALTPGSRVHVRKFRRPGTVVRVDPRRRVATVAHGAMQWELGWDELEPATD